MIIVAALLGWLSGRAVVLASDRIPRLSPRFDARQPLPSLRLWPAWGGRWPHAHAAVEFGLLLGFGLIWLACGLSLRGLLIGAGLTLFALISLIDFKYRLIPNVLVYPALVITLGLQLFILQTDPRSLVLGGGLAFGVFVLTAYLKPGTLGGGDVKLAALLGLMFGFPGILIALLLGTGAGALWAIWLLRSRAKTATIPYAPFLCFGAMIMLFFQSM